MKIEFQAKQIITITGEGMEWNDAVKYCRENGYDIIQTGQTPVRQNTPVKFVIRAERPYREADGGTDAQKT